jgi:hypothetical protein
MVMKYPLIINNYTKIVKRIEHSVKTEKPTLASLDGSEPGEVARIRKALKATSTVGFNRMPSASLGLT